MVEEVVGGESAETGRTSRALAPNFEPAYRGRIRDRVRDDNLGREAQLAILLGGLKEPGVVA